MEIHTRTWLTPDGLVEGVQTKWSAFNILLVTGSRGFLACPAIDVEACAGYGVAAAIVESYKSSLSDLATLAEAASDNPLLVLTGRWRSGMATCLATLKAGGDKVRELSSPPEGEEAHGHLLEASQHIDRGAELASDAMTRLDTAKIQEAVTEMQLGYEALNAADEELQKLQSFFTVGAVVESKKRNGS